jgi:hypothetical protein
MSCLALPPPAADRLAKLCGLLGSDYEGERATAAAAATRLLRHHGLTWDQLVRCSTAPLPSVLRPATAGRGPADHRTRALVALRQAHRLNGWELAFLHSIAGRPGPLSPKQAATLRRIEERLGP